MPKKTPRDWSISLINELRKHANRDNCYKCKELLRKMAEHYGLDPEKLIKGDLDSK